MTQRTRIVAIVVDAQNMTVYKDDGIALTIPQGDLRIRKILDQATPSLMANGFAFVDLSDPSNTYNEFEKKTGGLVRLFRVAKAKIKEFFASSAASADVPPIPEKMSAALDDLMAHATPANHPNFTEQGLDEQQEIMDEHGSTDGVHNPAISADTIVAVVDGKLVPGVELIKSQFSRAAKQESTVGMQRFLERIATVAGERKHSVEDLLKFLERGDLPIADDGTILIYKVLRESRNTNTHVHTYVDCHTGKVGQSVGSLVQMAPSLVDEDRNKDCSHGLHVARRGYISQFPGDVCVIAKLAPEDVIAVPEYDANKMRVCAYHIIHELSSEQYTLLRNNKPITFTEEGKFLLGRLLAGNHIGVEQTTTINGAFGSNLVYATVGSTPTEAAKFVPEIAVEAMGNLEKDALAPAVDPRELNKEMDAVKMAQPNNREQIRALLPVTNPETAMKVMAIKKAAKKGWAALGVSDDEAEAISKFLTP